MGVGECHGGVTRLATRVADARKCAGAVHAPTPYPIRSLLMSAKPQTHVIRKGDKVSAIAKTYGFADWKVVWNDKANDALRKLRKTPEGVEAGDKIVIPLNPEVVKENQEQLLKLQTALDRTRKLRVESEKSFQEMEKELEDAFEDMEDLSAAVDLAALIATAFVGAAVEGATILKGVRAAEKEAVGVAVKGGLKVAALEIAVGIAQPSWWANLIVKRITGQDNKTAFKVARDQLLKVKSQSLTNVDIRIHDLERRLTNAGR